jgi:Phage protein Gp138 N-terminal domain
MDRRERLNDADTALITSQRGREAGLWTGFPGIIKAYDPVKMTCSVQPALKMVQVTPGANGDNTLSHVSMPLLTDCPVIFPCGGNTILTFPIALEDECWVDVADRCIDGWWQSGGEQQQMERRMHDLSDGFVTVGPRSQPKVVGNISTETTQLRSLDGKVYVEVDPRGNVNIVAPGVVDVTSPNTETSGNVLVGTGASGTFTTANGLTVTVQDGIITNIF